MKTAYSSATHHWYLCECARQSCREQFYMRIRDYERATLGDGVRMVVPEHVPRGVTPLARWSGVAMIGRS